MALLKRQLYRQQSIADLDNEDWWSLVFDSHTRSLYVEHEWGDVDADKDGGPRTGSVQLEITSYLGAGTFGPGQRELVRLIMTLFG